MKHYFKKLRVFLYIFVAFFANSCSEEKDYVKGQNHEKIKIEEQSFDKLLQLPVFNDAYQRVVKAKTKIANSTMARTALEEQYGFDIVVDAPVKVITDENGISYIMLIERTIKENLIFENLLINIKNNEIQAIIIKYQLSEKATRIAELDTYKMNIIQTSYTALEVDGKKAFDQLCIEIRIVICNDLGNPGDGYSPNHLATDFCMEHSNDLTYYNFIICEPGGGGPDDDEQNGNGNPNVQSNPNLGGNVTINSVPIPSIEDVINNETPCDKLKKLIETTPQNPINPFKEALKENENDATNVSYEKGYRLRINSSYGLTIEPVINNNPTNGNKLAFSPGAVTVAFFHSHPSSSGLFEIFSHDDILLFYNMIKKYNNNNPLYSNGTPVDYDNFVITVAVSSIVNGNTVKSTYAIKISDLQTFKDKCAAILSSQEKYNKFKRVFENQLSKNQYDSYGLFIGGSDRNEENMLNAINDLFGNSISLYKAEHDFSNWNKLVIENHQVTKKPCNN